MLTKVRAIIKIKQIISVDIVSVIIRIHVFCFIVEIIARVPYKMPAIKPKINKIKKSFSCNMYDKFT